MRRGAWDAPGAGRRVRLCEAMPDAMTAGCRLLTASAPWLRTQRDARCAAEFLRGGLPLRDRRHSGALARDGKIALSVVQDAITALKIDAEKVNPATA